MEFTKEYFDQKFKQSDERFEKLMTFLQENMATKADLREAVEELARLTAETVANPMEQHFAEVKAELAMHQRVRQLETDMRKIKEALRIV